MSGYGKGWSEPKASGRWARFRQRLREPATKRDYTIAFAGASAAIVVWQTALIWALR